MGWAAGGLTPLVVRRVCVPYVSVRPSAGARSTSRWRIATLLLEGMLPEGAVPGVVVVEAKEFEVDVEVDVEVDEAGVEGKASARPR